MLPNGLWLLSHYTRQNLLYLTGYRKDMLPSGLEKTWQEMGESTLPWRLQKQPSPSLLLTL